MFCDSWWHGFEWIMIWWFMSWIYVTSRRRKIHAERMDARRYTKLAQCWKPGLRIACLNMELKSKVIPCRTINTNPGWWSAEGWTNTQLIFSRRTRIAFTAKKWRQYWETRCDTTEGTIHSVMICTLHDCCADLSAELERHSCHWIRCWVILILQCLQDNNPNYCDIEVFVEK